MVDGNLGVLGLGGGGNEEQSAAFDRVFFDPSKHKSVAYIPIAWARDAKGYEASYEWFTGMLARYCPDASVDMWLDLSVISAAKAQQYDCIYIGGGNTYSLMKCLRDTGFDQVLIEYFTCGGTIYGGSAGAIVLGKSIATVSEENELGAGAIHNGLNLLGGISVRCHYTPAERGLIDNCLGNGISPILCLTETNGAIFQSGNLTLLGRDPGFIFDSPTSIREIEPVTEGAKQIDSTSS